MARAEYHPSAAAAHSQDQLVDWGRFGDVGYLLIGSWMAGEISAEDVDVGLELSSTGPFQRQ